MTVQTSTESDYSDFYLIRHLEAELPVKGKVLCGGSAPNSEFDTELNSDSKTKLNTLAEKVAELHKSVPIAAVYASPFKRTMGTVQPVADKLGLTLKTEKALDELNHGIFVGMKSEEWKNHPSWKAYSTLSRMEKFSSRQSDGAETNCEVIDRVRGFCLTAAPQYLGKSVVCCTSDGTMRALLNLATIEKVYGTLGKKSSTEAVLELQQKGINVEDAKHFEKGDILHIRVNPRTQEIRILETRTVFPKAPAEKE